VCHKIMMSSSDLVDSLVASLETMDLTQNLDVAAILPVDNSIR
jgi:hypothetical protein